MSVSLPMPPMGERPQIADGVPTWLGIRPAFQAADLAGADVAIIGVPYLAPLFGFDADLTPRKLRQASARYPGGYLPEFDLDPLQELDVVDFGDAAIVANDLATSLANVQAKVDDALRAGALPITLGGSAPCSGLAAAAAIAEHLGGRPVGVVNLDAHGDNREHWQGDRGPHAATWVRHLLALPGFAAAHHMQVGMRGPGNPESNAAWFRTQGCGLYTGLQIRRMGIEALIAELIDRAGAGTTGIWLGIDWDVLDIGASPEWVYPEPFGLSADELLLIAFAVGRHGCVGASTMSSPAHAPSLHWIATWAILYLLAGKVIAGREAGADKQREEQRG